MIKYVDVEALNLRSEPVISPETRKAILHLGQQVEEMEPDPEPGWKSIKTKIQGKSVKGFVRANIDSQPSTGFVTMPSLRHAVSDARETLVTEAVNQWLRFEQGQAKEHHDPYFRFVGEMWNSINLNLDGRDRDTPWSAAAISYMVRNASKQSPKYGNFKFAPAHSKYIHDSIIKRNAGNNAAPFWGYRLHEMQPKIGDIVGRWRETARDFDDASENDSFKSHTDIIVSVRPDHVIAIGGNVRHSVSTTRYQKTPAGFLADSDGVFILMANQG